MPDFSRMFENNSDSSAFDVKTSIMSIVEIASYRQDLSDKVREHIDLIETIIVNDKNPIIEAEEQVRQLARKVNKHQKEMSSWSLRSLFSAKSAIDMTALVRADIDNVDQMLVGLLTPNTAEIKQAEQVIAQSIYLSEQLVKVAKELEKRIPSCNDALEIDAINRRCKTFFMQQELVSSGHVQVSEIASDLATRPQQAKDLLNTVTPACRLLCLDVLSGKNKPDDLRKFYE